MFLSRLWWVCLSAGFAVTRFAATFRARRLRLALFFSLALALSASICNAQQLPNPQLTPGAIRADATAKQLCAKSFRTGPYRKTTAAMKKHVCLAYHVKPCPKAKKMELDHLIPLELGGLDDERNLWVQFAPEFHYKDHLENYLKVQVCTGHISLADAQHELMSDWAASYEQHLGKLTLAH